MPSPRIAREYKDQTVFISCTIQKWYYLFDRHNRWEILAKSLEYCQRHKDLKIFAYIFMLNHIHLLAQAPDMSRVLCDFKKYTSRELMKNILLAEPHVAELFPQKNGKFKIWQETNCPIIIESEKFFLQKQQYIHENPVRKQYVENPEYWYWSSANPTQPLKITNGFE
ncbi:hypothetical protein HZA38_00530 [Candidatus Peregrinibacteria bacterium]|nr:hypothetical protein [Candidatus Peregrinibacteria bacterium]